MRNKSLCLFYDWFGTTIWLKSSDHTHRYTHPYTHTGRKTYLSALGGCATCFALVLAVLSIPWRQVSLAAAAAEAAVAAEAAAAATTVTATWHPLAPWRQPKFQPLWELAPTPAGKADNPRWGAAAPTWASAWRRRQVALQLHAQVSRPPAGAARQRAEGWASMGCAVSVLARQAAL